MATTYDPQKVIATFKGSRLTGFAPGTFITLKRNSDTFTLQVGSDGEVARSASADRSAECEIVLQQTSQSNDILSSAAELDELTKLGTGAFMLKDAGGTTLVSCPDAWVKKPTDIEFGNELSDRTWVLVLGKATYHVGGNI